MPNYKSKTDELNLEPLESSPRTPFGPARVAKHTYPACGEQPMLGPAIDRLLGAECALIIGTTRDGGALVLTVLDADQRHKTYCSSPEDLARAIEGIWHAYEPT